MTALTVVHLDEIELRALAAPREPWHVEPGPHDGYPQRICTDGAVIVAEVFEGGSEPFRTAEFLAAARTDVPRLVDDGRRLRRALSAIAEFARSRAGQSSAWAVVAEAAEQALAGGGPDV